MNWSLNLDKRIPTPLRILLRGAGQVVFCNNAVTGLIVLAAFYAGGTITGLAATVGLISSTVTAHACRFCKADIEAGLLDAFADEALTAFQQGHASEL